MAADGKDLAYAYFTRKIREVLGIDLEAYRPEQMRRRLTNFLEQQPGETFFSLGRRLASDPAFAQRMADYLTINVSEFFRNPERFRTLERILPTLAATRPLRIWSAACSIGAEPYSLAILALEQRLPVARLWATDIDRSALRRAEQGWYRPSEVKEVPPRLRERYFTRAGEGWQIRPEVRALVRFAQHDLLSDPFPSDWDLIVCRNVVIYFTEAAQAALYRRLAAALRPGGVLFVGATEAILYAEALGLTAKEPSFYVRQTGGSGHPETKPNVSERV